MTDTLKREAFSLKRWSQRKLAASRAAPASEPLPAAPAPPPADAGAASAPAPAAESAPAPLPPVDSLTIESDYTPFLQPDVDEVLQRGALRKLFSDPHFNVMDGLDIYIDDYSKPDPLDPAVARQLMQARYIFDPPVTRVNAQGHVEDVPADELPPAPAAAVPDEAAVAPLPSHEGPAESFVGPTADTIVAQSPEQAQVPVAPIDDAPSKSQ